VKNFCGDCGCREGELHKFFPECDMERCPICKGQLLSCGCDTTKIKDKIREPFFDWTFSCKRCEKVMPETKMVLDNEWKTICGVTYDLDCILCIRCMEFISKKREEKDGFCN